MKDEFPPLEEMIEQYQNQENAFSTEGKRGVENLRKLISAIGYAEEGTHRGNLQYFLEDNPGCVSAIIEWIGEQGVTEWKLALNEELVDLNEEEDHGDDEEENQS